MEYELYHYGRKGMKWYQNIFTSGKAAAAKRKKARAAKEKERAKAKAAKEKEAEEKRKESVEEQKAKIRSSRSAEQVYKNAHLFNDKELTEIYNRLNTENNIKNLIPKKVNKGKAFVENSANTIKNISTLVGNTTDMINKFKAFGNLFGGDKKPAASSRGNSQSKSKDKDNKSESKPDDSPNTSKPKGTGVKGMKWDTVKTVTGIVEDIPGYNRSNTATSAPKSKTIIDAEGWSVDTTALAKSMTNNVGSRTVNWAMNNQPRIESGSNFVNGFLTLPAPKDD